MRPHEHGGNSFSSSAAFGARRAVTTAGPLRASQRARSFPWERLDRAVRADVDATRVLHRWSRRLVRVGELESALSALLDARVEVHVRRIGAGETDDAPLKDGVALLVGACGAALSGAALVEVEPALAVALVARALRRSGPRVLASDPRADSLGGALAAIVLAATRRVHAENALRVFASGSARALARQRASAGEDALEANLSVLLDDDVFAARVLIPRGVALAAPDLSWTRTDLARLGDAPLSLAIVAAVSHSTAGELGTLRRGDAWLPGAWSLHRTPTGALEGPVLLASALYEGGLRAVLGDDGRIVVRDGFEPLGWTPDARERQASLERARPRYSIEEEERVTEGEKDALVEAVGEVPVVVRVEIGSVEMRAREWASLVPGDVVTLGKRIGEAVTLRVGGIAVARGELVDLEGEIAVRIQGRSDAEPSQGELRGTERS